MRRVIVDKQRSGLHRVRVEEPDGSWRPLGTFPEDEARALATETRAILAEEEHDRPRRSLATASSAWLKKRAAGDRARFTEHVLDATLLDEDGERATIADIDPRLLRPRQVRRWRDALLQKPARRRFRNGRTVVLDHPISSKTAREAMQLLRKFLDALVEDEAIEDNVARRVELPEVGKRKALSHLYPAEEAQLVRCEAVPLPYRVFYGVLCREGLRADEALSLDWDEVDLERGIIRLDENKTDEPRAWSLRADVLRTLRAWGARPSASTRVFAGVVGRADRFREHVELAGIRRPELFERSASRQPIRLHDTRATFVTVALAAGATDTFVRDRTGHTTTVMLERYRRPARTAAAVGLGPLLPLDELLGWKADPRRDPRKRQARGAARHLRAIQAAFNPSVGGSSPPGRTRIAGVFETPDPARIRIADRALAFAEAVDAGAVDAAFVFAREIALELGPLLAQAERLRAEVLSDGDHTLRACVQLLDIFWPGAAAELDRAEEA